MSPKSSTSVSTTVDSHCQHISPKGRRCHMLIDQNHRPSNGAARPILCAYHAGRLQTSAPAVDPEVLAAELLGDIDDFSTAGSVNLFLGNLVKQLARKRIARRDAVALAYISQLLLNTLPALERQLEAEKKPRKRRGRLKSSIVISNARANFYHPGTSHRPITRHSHSRTPIMRRAHRKTASDRRIAPSKCLG